MSDKPAPPLPESEKQRVVRVFISSTFRDMHAERDELLLFVFPELRKKCRERQVEFVEVDLRWGITEEETKQGKVLPIIMKEIEHSKPYFIGLLGERYGWVPDKVSQELIEREPWLKEHIGKTGKSVTELEILHGVINNPDMAKHAFFYFRDPAYIKSIPADKQEDFATEGTEDTEKLRKLKEKIRKSGMPVIENYPNPKKLGELVLEDLWTVIDEKFPLKDVPTALERERMDHEAFAAARQKVYIGREIYFKRLDEHVASANPPMVILGESGSGKSALIANWIKKHKEEYPDDFMVTHFIGGTADSADYVKILRRIMEEIRDRYEPKKKETEEGIRSFGKEKEDEIPTDPKKVVEVFPQWLAKASARGKCIFVLDALNQLEDKDNAPDLGWLPGFFPENIRVILSTLTVKTGKGFTAEDAEGAEKQAEEERGLTAKNTEGAKEQVWRRSWEALKRRGWQVLNIELLTEGERRVLVEKYLARFSRKLSEKNMNTIVAAQQTSNPLYLKALLDELLVFGIHEELGKKIDYYLKAETVDDLYEKVLERLEEDYEQERDGLVSEAMSLIWASRRGLSETELLELLGKDNEPMPRAYWSPLYLALEESLVSRSGLLNFFHDYLRKAVEDRYLSNPEQGTVQPSPLTPPTGGGERYIDKVGQTGDSSVTSTFMGEGQGGGGLSEQKRLAHLRLADYFEKRPLDARKTDELPWLLRQAETCDRLRACLLDIDQFLLIQNRDKVELMGYWVWLREERVMGKGYLESFESWSGKPSNQDLWISYAANNLAYFLLNAANHAEAEPLMHRAFLIFMQSLSIQHPNTQTVLNNYKALLQAMGRGAEDIRSDLEKLGQRFGVDLSGAGGQTGAQPSLKLRAVIEQMMRDPSKAQEVFKKLQGEDPALFEELLQFIQQQQR